MKPSARKRINDALREADLAVTCLGTGSLRVIIEQVVERAYKDGIKVGRIMQSGTFDGHSQ